MAAFGLFVLPYSIGTSPDSRICSFPMSLLQRDYPSFLEFPFVLYINDSEILSIIEIISPDDFPQISRERFPHEA